MLRFAVRLCRILAGTSVIGGTLANDSSGGQADDHADVAAFAGQTDAVCVSVA